MDDGGVRINELRLRVPGPEKGRSDEAMKMPVLPRVDPEALFRSLQVTKEEIQAEDEALQKFFDARNKKVIGKAVQRARMKKRAKKE